MYDSAQLYKLEHGPGVKLMTYIIREISRTQKDSPCEFGTVGSRESPRHTVIISSDLHTQIGSRA